MSRFLPGSGSILVVVRAAALVLGSLTSNFPLTEYTCLLMRSLGMWRSNRVLTISFGLYPFCANSKISRICRLQRFLKVQKIVDTTFAHSPFPNDSQALKEEIQRFLIQAKEEGSYELFLLELTTGVRQGELLALALSGVAGVHRPLQLDARGEHPL